MVLAITIAIDPAMLTRPPSPPAAAAPGPTAPPSETESRPVSARDPVTTRAPGDESPAIRGAFGAMAGAGFGVTPGVSFAPRALVRAEYVRLSAEIEGRFHAPSSADATRGSVRASLLLGILAPCYRGDLLSRPALIVRACLALALGRMAGSGGGVDVALEDSSFYAATGPRAALELPLGGSVALRVQTELLAPLVRTRLELNARDVWSSPPIVLDLAAGAVVLLP